MWVTQGVEIFRKLVLACIPVISFHQGMKVICDSTRCHCTEWVAADVRFVTPVLGKDAGSYIRY